MSSTSPSRAGGGVHQPLAWLVRLRWTAAVGQLVLVLVAHEVFRIPMPMGRVGLLVLLTVGTNLYLWRVLGRGGVPAGWLIPSVLVFDILNLTALLALTGAEHNPFSSFYLVHVTLAAVLLPPRWTWALVGLCAACFGSLFVPGVQEAFCGDPGWVHAMHQQGAAPSQRHLQGMLVSFLMTAAVIAYFAVHINELLRESERELSRTRLVAAENERFAALTTLAAGVAHELGSPLSTIAVASAELSRSAARVPGGEAILADAGLIRQEVNRCRRIMDRLNRDWTGGIEEEPRRTTAVEIAHATRAQLPPLDAARLVVVDETSGESWRLPRLMLSQSLANLVRNGCDASGQAEPVELRIRAGGSGWVAEVRDRGVGIPPENLTRLGEPFFTTKSPGHGMGLGLFLVRLFANRVGGRLEFESAPGQFTRARLTLPLSTP